VPRRAIPLATAVVVAVVVAAPAAPAAHSPARVAQLRAYVDSGAYGRDVRAVARRAQRALRAQLDGARPARPAIVLDVDETALSNLAQLRASDFGARPVPARLDARPRPALAPVRALYRFARSRRTAVFFVTGRAPARRARTARDLRAAGYDRGWTAAAFRPRSQATVAFKSATRAGIERRGYTILVNVGDQRSDLRGGHARRPFKLPNPFYTIR
jgi:predicted secreted acid phosphatase